jgi:tRNA threonylcarbamoyladenosine biosynthesis protein TsaE
LSGELGAGKSVLARAIARGAGASGPMPSPTFNLVLRYPASNGRIVTHIDLFRLDRVEDVWELGWAELGAEGEIVLIEWPERAAPLLPPDRWEITLRTLEDPLLRSVSARAVGEPPPLAPPPPSPESSPRPNPLS